MNKAEKLNTQQILDLLPKRMRAMDLVIDFQNLETYKDGVRVAYITPGVVHKTTLGYTLKEALLKMVSYLLSEGDITNKQIEDLTNKL